MKIFLPLRAPGGIEAFSSSPVARLICIGSSKLDAVVFGSFLGLYLMKKDVAAQIDEDFAEWLAALLRLDKNQRRELISKGFSKGDNVGSISSAFDSEERRD